MNVDDVIGRRTKPLVVVGEPRRLRRERQREGAEGSGAAFSFTLGDPL